MSNKLNHKAWCKDIGIRECDTTTKCDDCKAAWNFCQAQEQKEIEELKKKVEELEKESNELKKSSSVLAEELGRLMKMLKDQKEGAFLLRSFCKIGELNKENESLKKKLEKAKEVIELIDYQFCASFGDADNIRGAINTARAYLKESV